MVDISTTRPPRIAAKGNQTELKAVPCLLFKQIALMGIHPLPPGSPVQIAPPLALVGTRAVFDRRSVS